MQDIWKIVSTRLLQQDYDTLVEIAQREGKTEPEIIRLGIQALFQEYPMFDVLKSPFTSKSLERLLPELVEAFIPILEKTIVYAQKEYNEAASINPKIIRLKNKLLKESRNVKGFEFSPFEIEEPKMEKPKGVINYNRLDGFEELKAMKEIKIVGDMMDKRMKTPNTKIGKIPRLTPMDKYFKKPHGGTTTGTNL
ncbi:MAG: hypothetical protein EX285_05680 [Thaumarchaeota archaeon]|nr:hypothetical protein [Nitrososphaerota archaeon]